MICPFCSNERTRVVDKRETGKGTVTRRRRECLECGKRFTTYERLESLDLYIIKKDGRREPYDRQKLKAGLLKACEKRPVSQETINKIADKGYQTARQTIREQNHTNQKQKNNAQQIIRGRKNVK